jgi:hypothetical protein
MSEKQDRVLEREINKLFWRANFDKKEWKIYRKHEAKKKAIAIALGYRGPIT